MDYKNRQILIVVLFLGILAAILYWLVWGNRGVLEVSLSEPYSVL
jgi:hypothetical protein